MTSSENKSVRSQCCVRVCHSCHGRGDTRYFVGLLKGIERKRSVRMALVGKALDSLSRLSPVRKESVFHTMRTGPLNGFAKDLCVKITPESYMTKEIRWDLEFWPSFGFVPEAVVLGIFY